MRPTFFFKACAAALLALGLTAAAAAQEAGRDAPRPPAIDVKPLEDVAQRGRELIRRGELDLSRDVEMTAIGALDGDGSFKRETVIIEGEGDERQSSFWAAVVEAVSSSRVLRVLDGVEAARLSVKLDSRTLRCAVSGDLVSAQRAAQAADAYTMMLKLARAAKQGTDSGRFYEGMRVTADGRRLEMAVELPRAEAMRMINELLDRRAAGSR